MVLPKEEKRNEPKNADEYEQIRLEGANTGHSSRISIPWGYAIEPQKELEEYFNKLKYHMVPEPHKISRGSDIYHSWRKYIYARDEYRCVVCGGKGIIHAHHLWCFHEYPDFRIDPDKGVSLCKRCHNDFHKKHGKIGVTANDFFEYMRSKKSTEKTLWLFTRIAIQH